ncbi:MAG: putative porin [Balneolaceae bacterium]
MKLLLAILFTGVLAAESRGQVIPDTLETAPADSLDEEPARTFEVTVWPSETRPGFNPVETDSTLRWFMALDWTSRLARQPGAITYRTGSLGRPSGADVLTWESRHQSLELYDMPLHSGVTGQVDWNRLPIYKIEEIGVREQGARIGWSARLRDHYLTVPRTYLNFDESHEEYRSLEFTYTRNFGDRTNAEISYWDRRDGNIYPRNSMEGRQIYAQVRHHLDETLLIRGGFINNAIDLEESFGYVMNDLRFYHFNPYNAAAVSGGSGSETVTSDYYLHLLQRRDSTGTPFRSAGATLQREQWSMNYSGGVPSYNLTEAALYGWQEFEPGRARIRMHARGYVQRDAEREALSQHSWFGWSGRAEAELPAGDWLTAEGYALYNGRTGGRQGVEASASLRFRPIGGLEISFHGGAASLIPDLQALYWDQGDFQGDAGLDNEMALFAGGKTRIGLGRWLEAGLSGGWRRTEKGVMVSESGQFLNIDPYETLAATSWFGLESPHVEGELSVTGALFRSSSLQELNRSLDENGERIWMKGSLYWKNYLFNRATFVKAGVSGMFSPGGYQSASYLPQLRRWQHGLEDRTTPWFSRLDLDVSARVRWMMVLLRWENILDRVVQPGYFETAGYPMPGMRFMFGLRVLFTN